MFKRLLLTSAACLVAFSALSQTYRDKNGSIVAPTVVIPANSYVTIAPSDTAVLPALRGIRADCTVAGLVTLQALDGSTYVWHLTTGLNQLADAPALVLATGLTATAVFTGLK